MFFHKVAFLGKVVREKGVAIAPKEPEVVHKWPVPKTKAELSTFMGFAGYHHNHISNFAEIIAYLSAMTGSKAKFVWTDEHQTAFENVKALVLAHCLAFPNPDDPFILDTDASDLSIGAELS